MAARLARLSLVAAGILSLGVALLNIANFEHHTQSTSAIATYYGLPIAVATASFAALLLPIVYQQVLSICGISALIALYAAELYFTVVTPKIESFPGAAMARDTRTKAQVIRDLRAGSVDALPYITSGHTQVGNDLGVVSDARAIDARQIWPLGSVSDATLVVCREGAEYLIYRSDEHGFNNPRGLWRQPLDIAAVGDSFTHGECVEREKSFMGVIRSAHPATLNLGVSGTGPLSQLALIREYLPALQPRIVLWIFFAGNDIADLEREAKNPILVKYLTPGFSQDLRSRQSDVDQTLRSQAEEALQRRMGFEAAQNRQRWLDVIKLHRVRLILRVSRNRQPPPSEESFRQLKNVLDAAKQTVESWGGRLAFVYLPSWTKYHRELQRTDEASTHERVLALARSLALPTVDVSLAIEAAAHDPLTLYQGHFNDAGNKVAAHAILSAVIQDAASARH